jgi:hypothetical protein
MPEPLSVKVALMSAVATIPVALFGGSVEETEGAALSILTVRVFGDSWLPALSIAK